MDFDSSSVVDSSVVHGSGKRQGRVFPLTLPQLDFWEEFLFHPDEPVSTVAHYVDIQGVVDERALVKAVQSVVAEADVLATRFILDSSGSGVKQVHNEESMPKVSVIDLCGTDDPMDMAIRLMNDDCMSKLDLLRDPVSRTLVIRISDDHYLWYIRSHHIIVDGFSMALLERRCATLYGYFSGHEQMGKPFGHLEAFLEEESSYIKSDRHEKDSQYWKDLLSNGSAPILLDKADEDYGQEGHHDSRQFSERLIGQLRDLSVDQLATWPDVLVALSMLYMVAAGVVASGMNADREADESNLVWLPYMGRWGSVAANIPAMVVNILPVRVFVDVNASLGAYMESTLRMLSESRRHGRYRVEQMAMDRGVPEGRRFFFSPLINVLPFSGVSFHGCTSESHVLASGPGDGFNLTFRGAENGDGLCVHTDVDERSMNRRRFLGICDGIQPFLEEALLTNSTSRPVSDLMSMVGRP